jgi:hypothetical protein
MTAQQPTDVPHVGTVLLPGAIGDEAMAPRPTTSGARTRRSASGLTPPYDDYPYLVTRIGHCALRHMAVLPTTWSHERLVGLARRQAAANRLDIPYWRPARRKQNLPLGWPLILPPQSPRGACAPQRESRRAITDPAGSRASSFSLELSKDEQASTPSIAQLVVSGGGQRNGSTARNARRRRTVPSWPVRMATRTQDAWILSAGSTPR